MVGVASAAWLAVLLVAAVLYFCRHFGYWRCRGVPYDNPWTLPALLAAGWKGMPWWKPMWQRLDNVYWKYKNKRRFAGYFEASRPVLVPLDPDFIQLVLAKEFSSFQHRDFPHDEEGDPLSANLFTLTGKRWKWLRNKLLPTFTPRKMRLMFDHLVKHSLEFNAKLKVSAAREEDVEFKALLMQVATDIIGSCAFGIDSDSEQHLRSEFQVMGEEAARKSLAMQIRQILVAINAGFATILPLKLVLAKHHHFFINLMQKTVEYRQSTNVNRIDLVQLMMELLDYSEADAKVGDAAFNVNLMAAQSFVFFIAGLENVANTIAFCLNELAYEPVLQERAASEVRAMVALHGDGALNYEVVQHMDLVRRIVSEGLRLWTPISVLVRAVTAPIRLPCSEVTLDCTPLVYVPVWQLHHDPAYYPDPERFDPERFTREAKAARHPYVYLPFGAGPRACIAERFSRLEMQLCLAAVLKDFRVLPTERSHRRPMYEENLFQPGPKEGFWFRLEERAPQKLE